MVRFYRCPFSCPKLDRLFQRGKASSSVLNKWNKEMFGKVELNLKILQDGIDKIDRVEEQGGMNAILNAKRSYMRASLVHLELHFPTFTTSH